MTTKPSPTILALDTSTEACSAALITGDAQYHEFAICPREHNQRILTMVTEVLAKAELNLADVDAIAFGCGPGSFTGVRIATGMVQGLAYGANKPVVAVSSLAAMAHGVFRQEAKQDVIAAIDARMDEIYLAAYHIEALGQVSLIGEEAVTKPADSLSKYDLNQTWAGVGTGWQTYQTELTEQIKADISEQVIFPSALDIAMIAATKFNQADVSQAAEVQPSYLRNEVAWKKLPGRE